MTDTDQTSRPDPTLPQPGECFLCFTGRMLTASGGDSTLRWVRRWRDLRAPHARALEGRLGRHGGFCDCEVLLNGFTRREDVLVAEDDGDLAGPGEQPPCAGCGPGRPGRARRGRLAEGAGDAPGQDGGMGQVVATTERVVRAPADVVRAALADYEVVRPKVLPEQFSEYRVDAGGQGAGTRAHWRLQATSKRVRVQDVVVTEGPSGELVEKDANSSMTTTWSVQSVDPDASTVRVRSEWQGAGGIGGFFERTFAPKGLGRIHAAVLERLDREVAAR